MFVYARETFLGIDEDADTDTVSSVDAKVTGVRRTKVGTAFTLAAMDRSTHSPGKTSMTWYSLESGELVVAAEGGVVAAVNVKVLGGNP